MLSDPLQWRHNEPHHCLLNRLYRRRSKETSKLRVTGPCAGIHWWPVNSPHKGPVTRKIFPFDDGIMSANKCTWYIVHLYVIDILHLTRGGEPASPVAMAEFIISIIDERSTHGVLYSLTRMAGVICKSDSTRCFICEEFKVHLEFWHG